MRCNTHTCANLDFVAMRTGKPVKLHQRQGLVTELDRRGDSLLVWTELHGRHYMAIVPAASCQLYGANELRDEFVAKYQQQGWLLTTPHQ